MYIRMLIVIIISNIASGSCKTRFPLDICRALGGLSAASLVILCRQGFQIDVLLTECTD